MTVALSDTVTSETAQENPTCRFLRMSSKVEIWGGAVVGDWMNYVATLVMIPLLSLTEA